MDVDVTAEHEEELLSEADYQPKLRPKNFTLSPNDIERCEVCPASRVYTGPKPKPHPAMWYGIFVHRFLQYCVSRSHKEALAYVRSKKNKGVVNVCEKINPKQIPDGIPELSLALNVIDGTADATEREFADHDKHIFGIADLVFNEDGWNVWDYKTGESRLDPAVNTQLLTLSCAVQRLHGGSETVKGAIVDVLKTGELVPHVAEYSAQTLKRHYQRVRRVHLMVLETRAELVEERIEPDVVPGNHCFGCRAREACVGAALFKANGGKL